VISAKNEDNCLIEQTGGGLTSGLVKFKTRRMGIVPFIMINIVVFTTTKLDFIVSVIPTECVNKAFVIDSRKERLFGRHRSSNSQFSILVLQIAVSRAVGA
jgi:hypothetical protein